MPGPVTLRLDAFVESMSTLPPPPSSGDRHHSSPSATEDPEANKSTQLGSDGHGPPDPPTPGLHWPRHSQILPDSHSPQRAGLPHSNKSEAGSAQKTQEEGPL
ncbi:hypothetical protein H920_06842 [Fukomys damarensis]|uniref:Uncharacterized protein n=1 Tax=Fukomys damarensis TaxID=885580 RepID=A0A091E9C7_FUKDA|nr:hypothetical protein H920_06842 [Fukomys damarensis]